MKPLLTTKDVAKIFGTSRHAVGRFVRDGLLIPVKFSETARPKFTEEAVADFLKRCQAAAPELPPVIESEVRQTQQKRPPVDRGQRDKKESEPKWYEKYGRK